MGDIFKCITLSEADYILKLPSSFYKCSPNASKSLHYVTNNSKVVAFQQLDVKYNRPDRILEKIENSDKALIAAYKNAYEKRIKKLGIDTSAFNGRFSVPEADFTNRDSLDYDQRNNQLKLKILGKDSSSFLDRFNIWINETPLFGIKGFSLKSRRSNKLDTTLTVSLFSFFTF